MEFDWDDSKAEANERKHGVTFTEATTVFTDPLSRTFFDPEHSEREDRFVTIGVSTTGRTLVVAHAERGDTIRIINARKATRRERKDYEEAP